MCVNEADVVKKMPFSYRISKKAELVEMFH